ncbi:MAG: MMPL family transporter [Acholeplasmataceae bacterium]
MKSKIIILSIVLIITLISALLIPLVQTNYDLTKYLPKDSETKQGLDMLEDEFGNHSLIELQLLDTTPLEVIAIKDKIKQVEHVESVIWLDDYVDLNSVPIEYIDQNTLDKFYLNSNALIQISVDLDSYALEQETVIFEIEKLLPEGSYAFRSEVLRNIENRDIANQETIKIMLLILPVVIIILLLASSSWIEPIILLISLGFAVVMNLGTNILLPDVSFITQTMALALQLALSLDYGLFLIHRYHEEREKTDDINLAIKQAFKRSFSSITASALTTIAGFLSLFFMRYSIGFDIGIVLSKGILFSYLTTMIVTPVLIYFMHHLIDKTTHKTFIKPSKTCMRKLFKFRYFILILFIGLSVSSLIFSNKTEYIYGNNTAFNDDSQITIDENIISETFGSSQQVVLLVPNDNIPNEIDLATTLKAHPDIIDVQTLVTVVDPNTPRAYIPEDIKTEFIGPNYTRFIVSISLVEESDALYLLQEDIRQMLETYYPDDYYMIGQPQATENIKTLITEDQLMITLASVIAIFIILAITFKSITIPIILVLLIESAIWMNLSILYIQDIKTIYIGYLVVMAIQLGATIDYAVLLTNRYIENRKTHSPFNSIELSYQKSFLTIMISALVLSIAGFTEGIFSDISSVQDIGFLLGKGAFISFIYVLIFLPVLLVILDKILIIHFKHKNKSAQ